MAEDAVMWLALADVLAVAVLFALLRRQARDAATALDDARHEFETGLRFLQDRLLKPSRKGARRHDDSPR